MTIVNSENIDNYRNLETVLHKLIREANNLNMKLINNDFIYIDILLKWMFLYNRENLIQMLIKENVQLKSFNVDLSQGIVKEEIKITNKCFELLKDIVGDDNVKSMIHENRNFLLEHIEDEELKRKIECTLL